jgi:hypothetical protein
MIRVVSWKVDHALVGSLLGHLGVPLVGHPPIFATQCKCVVSVCLIDSTPSKNCDDPSGDGPGGHTFSGRWAARGEASHGTAAAAVRSLSVHHNDDVSALDLGASSTSMRPATVAPSWRSSSTKA